MDKRMIRNVVKKIPYAKTVYRALQESVTETPVSYGIPEITEMNMRALEGMKDFRINLVIPSVNKVHAFGGISTAVTFFEALREKLQCKARVISVDAAVEDIILSKAYEVAESDADSTADLQVVSFSDRYNKTIPVAENDVFVVTSWWTAYNTKNLIRQQNEIYGEKYRPIVYLIQDYEPGFYAWSSRYALAESTYKDSKNVFAVINSTELAEFMKHSGYNFAREYVFHPVFNEKIKKHLLAMPEKVEKKKKILVYGRPGVERNAFTLLVKALEKWVQSYDGAAEWEVLSAGEKHEDIPLGNQMALKSVGKLSLEQYAALLAETYAGVSLMVSPHPSYPPLEMAMFGIKTVTNTYANKDLSSFSENIFSVDSCTPERIAECLTEICQGYMDEVPLKKDHPFIQEKSPFAGIVSSLEEDLRAWMQS